MKSVKFTKSQLKSVESFFEFNNVSFMQANDVIITANILKIVIQETENFNDIDAIVISVPKKITYKDNNYHVDVVFNDGEKAKVCKVSQQTYSIERF